MKDNKYQNPEEWFNHFMQSMDEMREQQKQSSIEWDRKAAESKAEADKRKAESDKSMADLKSHLKELQKNIGGVSEANGKMIEELVFSVLEKDLTFAGIKFNTIERNVKLKYKRLKLEGEFDIVLENGDTIGLIETKYSVRKDYVTEIFSSKVEKFRSLFPQFAGYKFVLGIAGASFDDNAIDEANANGIGLIKVVGEKVEFQTENIKQY